MITSVMHNTSTIKPRVAMVQDGARRRYALPVALHEAGILEAMYTDWFVQPGSAIEAMTELAGYCSPGAGKRLAGRSCAALDTAPVICNPLLAARTALGGKDFQHVAEYYHWASQLAARWIERRGFGNANAMFGFVRNLDPDLVAHAKSQGLKTVADQIIAPAAVERDEALEQINRFPGWQDDVEDDELTAFVEWEKRTWEHLDRVVCMSDYVRDGLIREGVDPAKIKLIPYPIDATRFNVADRSQHDGRITIGFVGAVNLRKGAPYFFEVAKQFDPDKVRFVMIGKNYLDQAKLDEHKGHVQLIGRVPREEVAGRLDKFDIFFFPTTCEGSAGAVMEAMCCGLPVVTTYNAGSLVQDGLEGRIVQNGDVDGFVNALQQLVENANLRLQMGQAARQRAEQHHLHWYSNELSDLFTRLLNDGAASIEGR